MVNVADLCGQKVLGFDWMNDDDDDEWVDWWLIEFRVWLFDCSSLLAKIMP